MGELSWGKASRHIMWCDILYISWGHWTPVFVAKQDKLSSQRCLSVVARNKRVLDLEGYNQSVTQLWVRGLRQMMGHSDEYSNELSRRNLSNLLTEKGTESGCRCKKVSCKCKCREKRTACKCRITEVIKLQQDLFIMTTHTVLRELEEERIWIIDEKVQNAFGPQKMWPTVLKADVPWRSWKHWLREQITTYCRENGKFVHNNAVNNTTIYYPNTAAMHQPHGHNRGNDPNTECTLQ